MINFVRSEWDKRRQEILQARRDWEPIWRELSEYILPQHGKALYPNTHNKPWRNDSLIATMAPAVAQRALGAGMSAGMTSKSRPWYKLTLADKDLADFRSVREWLDIVQERSQAVFAGSNWYEIMSQVYGTMPTFGTGAFVIEEDFEDVIRARFFDIGSYAMMSDHRLAVTTLVRERYMSIWQMAKAFGVENLSKTSQALYKAGKDNARVKVIHIVCPNDDRSIYKLDNTNMPYLSLRYEEGGDPDRPLKVSGFHEKPFMTPRWEVIGEDDYGWGPGWLARPESSQLHAMADDRLVALDKSVNPPVQVPSGDSNLVNVAPGGVSFYSGPQGAQGNTIKPLYEVRPDFGAIQQMFHEQREFINQIYFVDMFLLLSQGDKQDRTAREIAEMHEEKLLMLGPVLERVQKEGLAESIDRTLGIMGRGGLLPPPPKEIVNHELKIEFVSILAQAQQMVELTRIEQAIGFTGNMAGVFPESLDLVNVDATTRRYYSALSCPADILHDDKTVAEIRAGRRQKEEAMQAQAQAGQMAQGAKLLADTDLSKPTALKALMGGLGNA